MAEVGAIAAVPEEGFSSMARVAGRVAGLAESIATTVADARGAGARQTARDFAARAHRVAGTILDRHGVVVVSSGSHGGGPALVVANHVSYLDPIVVASVLPCIAVAKGETRGWPLVGRGLEALGVVFVRRGDAYSGAIALRRAMRALRQGTSVLNFPEGTTTDGRSVEPFRRGAFGLARLAGVPLVPATIAYDDPRIAWYGGAAFLPHYVQVARTRRTVARVRFGEPVMPGEHDDPAELAERVRAGIAATLAP
jgi:1-acyl-sn-glycerol-3-phosphate acyltransferase